MAKTMSITYQGYAQLRYNDAPVLPGDQLVVGWLDGFAMCERYDFVASEQTAPEPPTEQPSRVVLEQDGEDDGR